jgi:hypothetical protein
VAVAIAALRIVAAAVAVATVAAVAAALLVLVLALLLAALALLAVTAAGIGAGGVRPRRLRRVARCRLRGELRRAFPSRRVGSRRPGILVARRAAGSRPSGARAGPLSFVSFSDTGNPAGRRWMEQENEPEEAGGADGSGRWNQLSTALAGV